MIQANGYRDRTAAGQALAKCLPATLERETTLVLALPRGGVPVGREIARALGVPLDVFVVRKVGIPHQPETAMGALATGGVQLMDDALIAETGIAAEDVAARIAAERTELERREARYRGSRPALDVANRTVVLVDDGVATGYTMRVAILALRQLNPEKLIVAIPVGAPQTCELLSGLVDQLICPLQPTPFHAVGLYYDHFPPVTDDAVTEGIESVAESIPKTPESESSI